MWFAVETAFVDGNHLKSIPLFLDEDTGARIQPGTCLCKHYECPGNREEKFLKGLIEIHTDWFQTKEQAHAFINGALTYIVTMRKDPHGGLADFVKWETVSTSEGYEPWRSIYNII